MQLNPPPHLSPSSIGTFKQCPLKFKYSKIDLLKDEPSSASLLGNFVHDVLEELYKHEPDERTTQLAKILASQLWEDKWAETVVPFINNPAETKLFRWNAWWCIENLWKIEDPQKIFPSGLEQELNGEIAGVKIKGFIDRFSPIDDGFIISDYKTGKKPKPKWESDKFFQLLVYAYLLEPLGFGKAKELELIYLKDESKLTKTVTEKDLGLVEEEVLQTKKQIDIRCEKGEFEPQKSILCGWCSYKPICPAWKQ